MRENEGRYKPCRKINMAEKESVKCRSKTNTETKIVILIKKIRRDSENNDLSQGPLPTKRRNCIKRTQQNNNQDCMEGAETTFVTNYCQKSEINRNHYVCVSEAKRQ